jgi:hypothetical protein
MVVTCFNRQQPAARDGKFFRGGGFSRRPDLIRAGTGENFPRGGSGADPRNSNEAGVGVIWHPRGHHGDPIE